MSAASHVRRLPTLNESLPAAVTSDLSPVPGPRPRPRAPRPRAQIKAHSHLHADTMLAIRPRSALQSNVMRARSMTPRRRAGWPCLSPISSFLQRSLSVL